MPLHLTKVAFGVTSVDQLAARWRARADAGEAFLTTRYLPKRHEEVVGAGSLYWIVKHQLVARSAGQRAGRDRVQAVRPQVLGVHTSFVEHDVAEVSAHVRYGDRSRALAIRFEHRGDRWLCVALEFA